MRYLVVFIFLCACAPKADPQTSSQAPLSLYKTWTSYHAPAWKMTVVDATLTVPAHVIWEYYNFGGKCQSDVDTGWSAQVEYGKMIVSNSHAIEAIPAGQPACGQFDGTWDYYILDDGHLLLIPEFQANSSVEFQ